VSAGGAGASGGQGGEGGAPLPCQVDAEAGVCVNVVECTGDYAPVPGQCPGPAEIQCCIPTGGICNPAAAPQPNVGLEEAPGQDGCPPGMLGVATFCIDRFEASLLFADSGMPFSPYVNPGTTPVRAVSIQNAVPQGYINQLQADDACALAGKRLCSDQEWLRACQGPAGDIYPYGDLLEPGVCNDARAVHPAIEYFGTSDDWIWSELGNACLNQLPDSLDRAGSNAGCVSAEGALDLMGNLHEWTADPAGTFRGGFYVDTLLNGPGCLYATTAHGVTHWDYSTGFRCCADG
jgi:sulfatase modifying factor 1